MAVTFDKVKYIDRLKAVGVPEHYARAEADALEEALAETLEIRDMATKKDLLEMENRLVKWGVGLALGQTAIIAALVKLL